MSKVCEKCGKKPVAGRSYARRGLAKSKGGVGRKVTGVTKRRFSPNIQIVRIKEPGGTVRRGRFCAKCLRNGLRDGSIMKAPRKPRPPKEPAFAPAPVRRAEVRESVPEETPVSSERPAVSDRLAEEIEAAYEEEKAAERDAAAPPPEDQAPTSE